jgi:hypothetical protein
VQVKFDVERKRDDGTKYIETVVQERTLLGLDAWSENPPHNLRVAGQKLHQEIASELATNAEPEAETARRLARRVEHFRDELNRTDKWLSRVRLFFGNQNLATAVYASGLSQEVTIDDHGRLVFFDKEKGQYALGLRDLYLLRGQGGAHING